MSHHRRRPSPKPRTSPAALERLHPNAAGIDCGSAEHFVAVPPDRDAMPVRSFATFTGDLHRLADWLTASRVTHVAMEATGVYWIPVFEILETRGFDVILVNARHVKNVPGRKSDVSDCEWLRDLPILGLLRGSFRPAEAIVALRGYLRHRATLVEATGPLVQRMQKALVQMNVQLPLVVSDITGVTGLRILRDIVAGHRDPQHLAQHRDYRCRASEAEMVAALRGNYRAEHVFGLQQNLELFDTYQRQLTACDAAIERHLARLAARAPVPPSPLPAARRRQKPQHNEPRFDLRTPLHQLTGVDLSQIDGIGPYNALRLLSEIGTDMSRWPNREALHLLAHARPAEQDLGRTFAQQSHPAIGESCRGHPPRGRHESRADSDGARRLLSSPGVPRREAQGDHSHRSQARRPRLPNPERRACLRRSRGAVL